MKFAMLLSLVAASLLPAYAQQNIKHVIVLMEENRSFDHLLGWMKRDVNPKIDGLTGTECNPLNTSDPSSALVCVNDVQPYIIHVDPSHSVPSTGRQTYGEWPLPGTLPKDAPMNGFVYQYSLVQNGVPSEVIGAFAPKDVPVTATLAAEFAVFDRWFSSVAGPTQPNRMFLHSATSDGMANNNNLRLALGMPQKPIYQALVESGLTWTNYFQEVPSTLLLRWPRAPQNWSFKHFSAFATDCQEQTLPTFSFIDPRYFDFPGAPQNDNHPGGSNDLRNGEALVKTLYETLRNSPSWENSLLIITYDEHGGFYDHVPPPSSDIPNPDGKVSEDPVFDFERLGVRVPTIMISPYIEKGTIISRPDGPYANSEFEASSVPATLRKLFNLKGDFLTKRDAWAGTFEFVANRTTPRTDCPTTLPEAPVVDTPQVNDPVDDLQKEFVAIAAGLNGLFVTGDDMTEFEASFFIKEQVSKFFGKCMYGGEDLYDGEYCKKN